MRQIAQPIPSEIKITWEFTKAPDELLLMRIPLTEESPEETPQFKIILHYMELYVPRLIVNPKISIGIDNQLGNSDTGSGTKLTYFYSRVETFTEILTPGVLTWESQSLFPG